MFKKSNLPQVPTKSLRSRSHSGVTPESESLRSRSHSGVGVGVTPESLRSRSHSGVTPESESLRSRSRSHSGGTVTLVLVSPQFHYVKIYKW